MSLRTLFPVDWKDEQAAELARKQTALRRGNQKAAEIEDRVQALRTALNGAPEGEVREAVARELAFAETYLVKAQGGSDKILREIAALEERVQRWEKIWSWLRG